MEIFEKFKEDTDFSVLMSVYRKENPAYFRQAVDSVIRQTTKPAEVIIVKDGPLTDELEKVCNELQKEYSQYIRFIPLVENVGLGLALQRGVMECSNALIARMDTDDIAKPDRFAKQLKAFVDNPDIVLCGGFIEEFTDSVEDIDCIRKVPLSNRDIYEFAKKRNPINHMTVMFRKDAVLAAGNYQSFHLLEDYYLWYRMIMQDYKMMNLPDVLVSVRAGKEMTSRRGGWGYFKNEKKLYERFYHDDYINIREYLYVIFARMISRLLPNFIRKEVYYRFLREK